MGWIDLKGTVEGFEGFRQRSEFSQRVRSVHQRIKVGRSQGQRLVEVAQCSLPVLPVLLQNADPVVKFRNRGVECECLGISVTRFV